MIRKPSQMQPRVGIVFDFDGTLAPDSTSAFLRHRGFDAERFWSSDVQTRMDAGWDPVPAYLYELWRLSRAGGEGGAITKEDLRSFGAGMRLFEGAEGIFGRISQRIDTRHHGVSVEFYLISSGIGEILRATTIAGHFMGIWASDFHYDEAGGLEFPSNIVSFTDKTRYLFGLSKGFVGEGYLGKPFEVNRKIPFDQIRIPLDQVIFVGDGYTDIPCFHLVSKNHGVAIGVYETGREPQGGDQSLVEDGRVEDLVPADYGPNSELSILLEHAVDTVAAKAVERT